MQIFPPLARQALALGLLLALCGAASAQIAVSGLASQTVYADSVTFTVTLDAGYDGAAELDKTVIPLGEPVAVAAPDYHELTLRATNRVSGESSAELIQFIVRASERGSTEWGLPAWIPYPSVPAAAPELANAQLEFLLPPVYPASLEWPLVARLVDSNGTQVRANGTLVGSDGTTLTLRRGIGSGFLPAGQAAGALDYQAQLQGLTVSRSLLVEPEPIWTPVSGTLSGNLEWPENARMAVTGSLTVTAGSTLVIEPGTIVRLDPGVDLVIDGHLTLAGSTEHPIVLTPARRSEPWGGFILRGAAARVEATDSFFIGSGANPDWFDQNSGYDVHRNEQALFLVDGAELVLTNCFAFDHRGQFGHGKNGRITLDRCLVQKFITGGEYNGGTVRVYRSALIEFPEDSGTFDDADNDGIYFTTGNHELRDTLVGWAKDDGIDHGSGGTGSLVVSNCWVEACFHEAFAWSGGGRVIHMSDDVSLNCGQGIEAGWSTGSDSPRVYANHCLSLGNLSGARFGDNYDWTYNGFLQVTNSLLLYNYRDIFGYVWSDWTYRETQMDLHDNWLTAPNARHPDNKVWDPLTHADPLTPFMTTPPEAPVGVGLALRNTQLALERLIDGVPVGLSSFTRHPVTVTYAIEIPSQPTTQGTLEFLPGQTVKRIHVDLTPGLSPEVLRLQLTGAQGGEITGEDTVWYLGEAAASQELTLVPAGSWWAFLDDGSNLGTAWTAIDYADRDWSTGQAELGYGDAGAGRPESTLLSYGSDPNDKHITYYFRHLFSIEDPAAYDTLTLHLKRDDGAVVHLNGAPVFVSNITADPITYLSQASLASDDGTVFFTETVAPSLLRSGTNVLAVEIHQESPDSSDISFDLELTAPRPPSLELLTLGRERFLFWSTPGYVLQQTEALGDPWESVSAESPFALELSKQRAFYRLRSGNTSTP